MESRDLIYKWFDLKIKSKAPDQIYFISQVFQEHIVIVMTKGKNKKIKITKIHLFLLPTFPSHDGGVVTAPPPPPQIFFAVKIFENFFHRYMGI